MIQQLLIFTIGLFTLFLSGCGDSNSNSTENSDTVAPQLTLLNTQELILDISQAYIEYGAVAYDDVDGDITKDIEIDSNITLGIEGDYSVIYHVKDTANNETTLSRHVIIKDRLAELDTHTYETKWFNSAKTLWNDANPDNLYSYDYYHYQFPLDGDRIAGEPSDEPILPKEWMQTAGLGFSKFLKYPFKDSKYQYTDALVKEWKDKGFKNGRLHVPLYAMVDLDKDSSGATLKVNDLAKIKEICQLFINNDMPITISIVSGDDLSDNMLNDRNETFRRTIEWWRQLASYFKNESYLLAFENYVEYHGFDDIAIEKKDFKVKLDNNETHYQGFKDYRKWAITNWIRTPGYNNLMAEIARVIRITNPKRIVIYKPNGIGRNGMVNITPWRWGSEADYLDITNKRTPYWLISSGGSANLNLDYINAIRSDDEAKREDLLTNAKKNTWGPAINYYNGTKIPVWISLFGIKVDEDKIDSDLNGTDVTTDEIVNYINWYQGHIQNDAKDENNQTIKVSSGFQQTPWIWDFENQNWFYGKRNDRWENFERVWQTLSNWAKEFN
jgi:hypothetical protein